MIVHSYFVANAAKVTHRWKRYIRMASSIKRKFHLQRKVLQVSAFKIAVNHESILNQLWTNKPNHSTHTCAQWRNKYLVTILSWIHFTVIYFLIMVPTYPCFVLHSCLLAKLTQYVCTASYQSMRKQLITTKNNMA